MFKQLQATIQSNKNRKPIQVFIDTKKYLTTQYKSNQDKLDYFKDVHKESFCFITPYEQYGEFEYHHKYIELLEECCIYHLNKGGDINGNKVSYFVDGDIIVNEAFEDYRNCNKHIYYNQEIRDLYFEFNEDKEFGIYPPQFSYPDYPLGFSEQMDIGLSQWLDLNSTDGLFRDQLLSNLEFKTITVPYTDYSDEDEKIKTKELLILSSKIVSYKDKKEEIIHFTFDCMDSNLEDIAPNVYKLDGHIPVDQQEKIKQFVIDFLSNVDKVCFSYATEQTDSLFDFYGLLESKFVGKIDKNQETYYAITGGLRGDKVIYSPFESANLTNEGDEGNEDDNEDDKGDEDDDEFEYCNCEKCDRSYGRATL